MGVIFTLDPSTKSVVQQALDDLITELGKPCRLVYPPRWVFCGNCLWDPIGNKSSNRWKTGGPMPFDAGSPCPLCISSGKLAQETFEVLTFLCAWTPRSFFFPIPNLDIRTPFSMVQTKGYLKDMPKVERCDHMVFQIPIEGFGTRRYKLASEPGDSGNIIQGRYFIATWERAG